MRFSMFGYVHYAGPVAAGSWPASPSSLRPEVAAASMEAALRLFELAHAEGFDSLTVAEHHYAPRGLTPSPIVFAAALSQRVPGAHLSVYGTTLPLHNPVQVAEEYAMLDHLLEGRLTVGLFRGTPNEYLTYGTNPAASRAMFNEGVELVLRAWTEPEPFAWEGIYYRFRHVATWPQPYQRPHPRVLVSVMSAESATFAAEQRLDAAIAYLPLEITAAHAAAYRDAAASHGWEAGTDNVLYRHFAHLAPTDDQAAEEYAQYQFADPSSTLGSAPERRQETVALVLGNVLAAGWANQASGSAVANPAVLAAGAASPFIGSPDTVAEQIREIARTAEIGRFDVVLAGPGLPRDLAERNVKLFGGRVIPQLRALSPTS